MKILDLPISENESSVAYLRRVHACIMRLSPRRAKQIAEYALALNFRDGMNRRVNRPSLTLSYKNEPYR